MRTSLGSLFGDPDTVAPKVPLSLRKRERVRVRVRLDCMDTAEATGVGGRFLMVDVVLGQCRFVACLYFRTELIQNRTRFPGNGFQFGRR